MQGILGTKSLVFDDAVQGGNLNLSLLIAMSLEKHTR